MKWDSKYPNAKAGDEPQRCICKFDSEHPCCQCGVPTSWADIDFEAWLCSEECALALWKEFKDACARGDTVVVKK